MNGPRGAVRVPTAAPPQADVIAKQRAVQSRQVLEHAQLQDKHLQERATLPPGKPAASMQTRQQQETQSMESRHAAENAPPKATAKPAPKAAPSHAPAPKPKEGEKPPASR
jgi:hypothetical protein